MSQKHIVMFHIALFALEWSAASAWLSASKSAKTIVCGHSVGEIPAAVIAGSLTVRMGLELVLVRILLMICLSGEDEGMVVTQLSSQEAMQIVENSNSDVDIACLNAPRRTALSGRKLALKQVLESSHPHSSGVWLNDLPFAPHSKLQRKARESLALFLKHAEKRENYPFIFDDVGRCVRLWDIM